MVDTFRPLELGEGGRAVDDGEVRLVVEPRSRRRRWSAMGDGSDYSIG